MAQDTHACLFLGQVDELEIAGERLDDDAGLFNRQRLDQVQQLLVGGSVAGPPGLGERADGLDQIEQFPAFLVNQGFTEQIAQKMDLIA